MLEPKNTYNRSKNFLGLDINKDSFLSIEKLFNEILIQETGNFVPDTVRYPSDLPILKKQVVFENSSVITNEIRADLKLSNIASLSDDIEREGNPVQSIDIIFRSSRDDKIVQVTMDTDRYNNGVKLAVSSTDRDYVSARMNDFLMAFNKIPTRGPMWHNHPYICRIALGIAIFLVWLLLIIYSVKFLEVPKKEIEAYATISGWVFIGISILIFSILNREFPLLNLRIVAHPQDRLRFWIIRVGAVLITVVIFPIIQSVLVDFVKSWWFPVGKP